MTWLVVLAVVVLYLLVGTGFLAVALRAARPDPEQEHLLANEALFLLLWPVMVVLAVVMWVVGSFVRMARWLGGVKA